MVIVRQADDRYAFRQLRPLLDHHLDVGLYGKRIENLLILERIGADECRLVGDDVAVNKSYGQ